MSPLPSLLTARGGLAEGYVRGWKENTDVDGVAQENLQEERKGWGGKSTESIGDGMEPIEEKGGNKISESTEEVKASWKTETHGHIGNGCCRSWRRLHS